MSCGKMLPQIRGVAQPGSASRSGREGRWFDSSLPDQILFQVFPLCLTAALDPLGRALRLSAFSRYVSL